MYFGRLLSLSSSVGAAAKNAYPTTPTPRTPSLTPKISSVAGLRSQMPRRIRSTGRSVSSTGLVVPSLRSPTRTERSNS
ncbi:hypothetical protein M407DRAFT_246837 [Tulasnella calospora MUT 4182]|uniref:Uncharacterized protein n=1 Tax=Tulasnella calospora MUT 4182 TaxID=1051891 RepID=A0A0C3Q2N4_9AGAM|nr:hypothetical protein M407DRAFT_246837 [Tulasnella calospora MUT 4182]